MCQHTCILSTWRDDVSILKDGAFGILVTWEMFVMPFDSLLNQLLSFKANSNSGFCGAFSYIGVFSYMSTQFMAYSNYLKGSMTSEMLSEPLEESTLSLPVSIVRFPSLLKYHIEWTWRWLEFDGKLLSTITRSNCGISVSLPAISYQIPFVLLFYFICCNKQFPPTISYFLEHSSSPQELLYFLYY